MPNIPADHPNIAFKASLMSATELDRALKRIAHEIVERNRGTANLALVGVHTRGVPVAERLAELLHKFEGTRPPVGKLDITDGSLREILTRTIEAVADWMIDHPRLNEFARNGPSFEGDQTLDAVGELKLRIIDRADGIIAAIQMAIGVEDSAFKLVPLAIVTMVEETLFAWVRSPAPTHTREEMIAHLADFTWYVIDGAARAIGFEVSPDEPLVAVVAALAAQASNPAL